MDSKKKKENMDILCNIELQEVLNEKQKQSAIKCILCYHLYKVQERGDSEILRHSCML